MKILFICVANSARSQIAEGLARSIFEDTVQVESAGSLPSGKIHPYAIEVLREKGIDLTAHRSKSWEELEEGFVERLDYIVTLCAEEQCPQFAHSAQKLHWGMPDPSAETSNPLGAFRKTRDEIERKLLSFKDEIQIH